MANYISSGGISDSSMMIMDEGDMGAEGAKGEVFRSLRQQQQRAGSKQTVKTVLSFDKGENVV